VDDEAGILFYENLPWLAKVEVFRVIAEVLLVDPRPHQAAIRVYIDLRHPQWDRSGKLVLVYAPRRGVNGAPGGVDALECPLSDPLVAGRSFIPYVSRVDRRFRLKQQHMHFFFSNRQVFNASGNDRKLALFQSNITFSEPDQQLSLHDEKQFVLRFVMMPDELSLKFCQFDVGVVQFADNPRTPILVEETQLLRC